MARGNITQFNEGNFANIPGPEPTAGKAGQIISQGLANIGAAMEKREEVSARLEAVAKFGDFEMGYVDLKLEHQAAYRDKPEGYARSVQDASKKYFDKYSKGMQGKVLENFTTMSTNMFAQDAPNLSAWADKRDVEKSVGNVYTAYGNAALKMESADTVEEMDAILGDPNNPIAGGTDMASIQAQSTEFIAEGPAFALYEQNRKQAISSGMSALIQRAPVQAYSDLAAGKYNDLLKGKKDTFLREAEIAANNDALLNRYSSVLTNSVDLLDMREGIVEGKVSVADVNRLITAAEINKGKKDANGKPMVSDDYIRGLKENRSVAMNTYKLTTDKPKDVSDVALKKFQAKLEIFLGGVDDKSSKLPSDDIDDVLGLFADLLQLKNKGTITEEQFLTEKNIVEAKLHAAVDTSGKTSTLREALKRAGGIRITPWSGRDVLSIGYGNINKYVKTFKDLNSEQRTTLRDAMLTDFTRQVQGLSEEDRGAINRDKDAYISRTIHGYQRSTPTGADAKKETWIPGIKDRYDTFKNPATGTLIFYGQSFVLDGKSVVYAGRDSETGNLQFAPNTEFLKALEL